MAGRWLGITVSLLGFAGVVSADEPPSAAAIEFFESKIRPVLVEHCYECHSAASKSVKGGLRLDLREAVLTGGESGPAVVPGDAAGSLLIAALKHESVQMPPERKLPDEVIADFTRWVAMGAPDPRDGVVLPPSSIDWSAAKSFWAFQPPQTQAIPKTTGRLLVQNRIDEFVSAALESQQLTPNPPADRRTLYRRAAFDLVGLPPSTEELDAFLADDNPDAISRQVDRWLASPQFGEQLARLWLDIMRYGEDQAHIVGDDRSLCYPNAYKYRDWLIAALNGDVGYDEFLRQQLAADLLQPDQPETHVALGFIGLGPKYYRRNSPEVMADEWEDRVDVVTRGVLGLTVACARCHDHKYDPISTADYYSLAGVFASTEMFNRPMGENVEVNDKGQAKQPDKALHIIRDQNPRDLTIFLRGDVTKPGPVAARKFLTALSNDDAATWTNGSGRRELAAALTDRHNPLTARVIVNRIWGRLFGEPLVSTASNFGALGERPSHPELLDDLAVRFMDHGWSLKWLYREIVLSAAYQRSSDATADNLARDPGNRWLWRMNRRRLSIEQFRDALLTVTGRLDDGVGGQSVNPHDPEVRRRTVYSQVSRLELDALLARFDFPDPNAHSDGRAETTTPLQKLFVLNSPFMQLQATALADRVVVDAASPTENLTALYRIVYQREPSSAERELGLHFVHEGEATKATWIQLAQALLVGNEFLILD